MKQRQERNFSTYSFDRGRRVPDRPRFDYGGVLLLPAVDEDWKPIPGQWVLPGRGIRTTEQLHQAATEQQIKTAILL